MRSPSPALAVALILAACSSGLPPDPVLPHDTFTMRSESLDEQRRINVYLPPGYLDSTATFPVLYMPDGGVAEDFPHITNTVDALIKEGAIAPCLVVGIENTQRRRDLTGPTEVAKDREVAPVVGGSAAFREFVLRELVPEIELRYRCTERRALVGESLAGLFVIETFLLSPSSFERCIAMSPSLWWNDHDLVRRAPSLVNAKVERPRRLWFTTANETDIAPYCDQLAAVLQEQQPHDLKWTYAPRKDLEHHTIFRGTKEAAFRAALWQP
ncbi:MAG: alpha/beta hydrolase [Planctomycetes bacterium]|nr:alpha/beta hydrolase [Planctomycetota bacterium]MCB9887652.1 alpha/beta hydrolase [Planctomycetota bacterium]